MECNRDDAIKARDVAEKKMQNNDFEGACKFVEKAKRLYPDLENITHLQAVCDVHIAAQSKVSVTEKDWYGILQVERNADDVTIKKQYRKLALVLHPDKNKFPGAESAFKLVGEANMVLSDKVKRSVYDTKCRATVQKPPPPRAANRNPRKQHGGAQNTFPNVPNMNQHQPAKPNGQQMAFWTCCPFCSIKYQYYRDYVNRALRCQNCSKPFIAHDIGSQGASLGSNGRSPVFPQQQQASKPQQQASKPQQQAAFKVDPQPCCKPDVNPSQKTVRPDQTAGPKGNAAMPKEPGNSRTKKRGRKSGDESSESFNTASSADSEDVIIEESGPHTSNISNRRRSARQKQQVSYSENLSDDDFTSPSKRSKVSKSSTEGQEEEKEEAAVKDDRVKQESVAPSDKNGNNEKVKQASKEEPVTMDANTKDSSDTDDDPVVYECPEPEFNDFDKDKEEKCFSVGQIWACYDTIDSMPRFYAEVRKVYSSEFKLRINWLEPDPDTEGEIEWVNEGLPVACGKFVRGDSEETSDRLMFSHRMLFEKIGKRSSYAIYPRRGEIWAVYKDWDIRWSSDPENHKVCKLEVVEVLSDFDGNGIRACYLEKVKGFLSLFQKTIRGGISSFWIPSGELFRFSHNIPSFQMTGAERDGVPIGSFELDPASLPPEFNEVCQPDEMKMETESVDCKVNGSCAKEKAESMRGNEKMSTPKKAGIQKETFERRRSPRELKTNPKHLNGTKEIGSSCLADERTHVKVDSSPQNVPEEVFYDFSKEKSIGKFEPGQIWAMYKDGLPNWYAQIKKIKYPPIVLQVQLLELCTSNQPLCCGIFKVQTGKSLFPADSFSHMVGAKPISKSVFEIYPKKGEIWAVVRNWTGDLSQSDLKNCEYDIVEVVNDTPRTTEVSALLRVAGFKSVFKNSRPSQRSDAGVLVIPRAELRRFSHQIPAFQLTGEKDGSLRGYWELDPAALPGSCIKDKIESTKNTEKMSTPKKYEKMSTPKKYEFERNLFELRRSPRESKTGTGHSNGTKEQIHVDSTSPKENSSSCLAAEKMYIDIDPSPNKLSEESFHDFSQEKAPSEFEIDQVWAMYKDGLPKTYTQIRKIEFRKFGLHVQSLELCTSTESLSCGIFRLQKGVTLHPPESFSHLVKAKAIIKGIFEIYPRKGEIWAMYKNWKATSSAHLENCEYEIVEILEDTEQFTEVSSLIRVAGFKSVFKSMRKRRSNTGFMVIPRAELGRFSHQIPAFQLNGEKDGRLRGFWELDRAAVPSDV